jgi:hypothetical protein
MTSIGTFPTSGIVLIVHYGTRSRRLQCVLIEPQVRASELAASLHSWEVDEPEKRGGGLSPSADERVRTLARACIP